MTTATETLPIVNPTRAHPTGVYVYHNANDGVAVALELGVGGGVTAALAVCSPRDQYSKTRAQQILRARLATRRFTSTDPARVALTFQLGVYKGTKFKDEVFTPIMDYVRDNAYLFMAQYRLGLTAGRTNRRELLRGFVQEIIKIRSYDQAHLS